MKASVPSGYLAPLANIVYHNFPFPAERYTLENVYVSDDRYYMVLRQERVDILLDSNGYPVKPTVDQIRAAASKCPVSLTEMRAEESGEGVSSSMSTADDGFTLKFYNADYYISDLQPGRNTVIDANTGLSDSLIHASR